MLIWYRNSIIASIISILGCFGIIAGVGDLMRDEAIRELGVPTSVGMIIGGLLLAVLGKVISMNKAGKQSSDTAKTVNGMNSAGSTFIGRRVGASIVFAAVCFLLAAAAGAWYCVAFNETYPGELSGMLIAEYAAYAALMIAAFITLGTQSANILHLIAFPALAVIYANNALVMYRVCGFESITATDGTTFHAMTLAPLIAAVSFLLMSVFSIFSMRRVKSAMGIVVRLLWFVPFLGLTMVFAKNIVDSGIYDYIVYCIKNGAAIHMTPGIIDAISQLFLIIAVFFTGYAFCRSCKKSKEQPASAISAPAQTYTAPTQTYTAPVQAPAASKGPFCPHCGKQNEIGSGFCRYCGNRITASQPAQPVYAQPVQPASEQSVQSAAGDAVGKQIAALKDLLDCGILSPEEYEQKVRELRG